MSRHNDLEIRELKSIIDSRAFANLLKVRKEYQQKEANRYVREKDIVSAYAAIAKYDDIEKTIEVIKKQIVKLEKED